MSVTLRVYPNPYAALDADGNPAGAFAAEGAPGSYLGASLQASGADPAFYDILKNGAEPAKRRFVFEDLAAPIVVPPTPHYLYGLRTGELLAADRATAREAGIEKTWKEPATALEAAKASACATYVATHGKPAACAAPPPAPDTPAPKTLKDKPAAPPQSKDGDK